MPSNLLVLVLGAFLAITPTYAGKFRGAIAANNSNAEKSLLEELGSDARQDRIKDLEHAMMTTYHALPKGADGHLGHDAVRYILHRLFIEQRGWFIRGLETSSSTSAQYIQTNWVPSYLQGILEKRYGENGISLHELAALAATLEDLIAQEAMGRFQALDGYVKLSKLVSAEEFKKFVRIFMIIYLRNENVPASDMEELNAYTERFMRGYRGWGETMEFLEQLLESSTQLTAEGLVDIDQNRNIFNDIGLKFHKLNDRQCRELNSTLVAFEEKPGRVHLGHFYNKSRYSHWTFKEKPDYLRAIGALDETEPGVQRLVISNYVQSMSNCLNSSSIYSMCCRNECEDLLAHLEKHVAAPVATTDQIMELVAGLPSESVSAPRKLADNLSSRLQEIAALHNGKVPLYSRLFAQWMHHAYPRECPYPHASGTISPQSPEEWVQQNGTSSTWESDAAMDEFISISCKADSHEGSTSDLPWHAEEELLLGGVHAHSQSTANQANDNPSHVLAHAALFSIVLVAVWYLFQPDDITSADVLPQHRRDNGPNMNNPLYTKIVHALALLMLSVIADPIFVAIIVVPGFLVLKVAPCVRGRLAVSRKLQHSKD